jgi:hypothetical protein
MGLPRPTGRELAAFRRVHVVRRKETTEAWRFDWTNHPQRCLCSSSGVVHRAMVTYPGAADTKCGKERLRCELLWLDGCTDPVFAGMQAAQRCPACFEEPTA